MKLSQPSTTQLIYQSYSWLATMFLLFPITGVLLFFDARRPLSIIQSDISNIGAWIVFMFDFYLIVVSLILTYQEIKHPTRIINRMAIFDKDLSKLILKTKTVFLRGSREDYSFGLINDIVVDGDRNKWDFSCIFHASLSKGKGSSCIAVRLKNGDLINLDGWYTTKGLDKKNQIVKQLRAFLNPP